MISTPESIRAAEKYLKKHNKMDYISIDNKNAYPNGDGYEQLMEAHKRNKVYMLMKWDFGGRQYR